MSIYLQSQAHLPADSQHGETKGKGDKGRGRWDKGEGRGQRNGEQGERERGRGAREGEGKWVKEEKG